MNKAAQTQTQLSRRKTGGGVGTEGQAGPLSRWLSELVLLPGLSGHEGEVAAQVRSVLAGLGIRSTSDRVGNVYVAVRGRSRRRLLVTAHLDEVGFLVGRARGKGWGAVPVGHARVSEREAAPVLIRASAGPVPGRVRRWEEGFFLAVEESGSQAEWIRPGDPVTFAAPPQSQGGRFSAKSLDNRVGCALLLDLASALQERVPGWSTHLVWTVREEYGFTGVLAAAHRIDPDVALTVDVTPAGPGYAKWEQPARLGRGAVLTLLDGGLLGYPELLDSLQQRAAESSLPLQVEVVSRGWSEASQLQKAAAGCPAAALCVPILHNGTAREVLDWHDLEAASKLLKRFSTDPCRRGGAPAGSGGKIKNRTGKSTW